MTCNNIKAAGVTLYTIQVNTGGDPTSTLLQNCASTSDKFFLLTSASQIMTDVQRDRHQPHQAARRQVSARPVNGKSRSRAAARNGRGFSRANRR